MNIEQIETILRCIKAWAETRSDIKAVAVVGSWARGEAKSTSDLDLMILTSEAEQYKSDSRWLPEIFESDPALIPTQWEDVTYGVVWSRHVRFATGEEVEFSFALPAWMKREPLDPGTEMVARSGIRILFDPDGLMNWLRAKYPVQINNIR